MFRQRTPVIVLTQSTKRETGRKAQLANIQAGKTISELVRTTLGPSAMLKMLLDPMGGTVITNDGNAILREIDVVHPAAKTVIELSRCQDEEVGDGTTSVVVLAGEVLSVAEPFLNRNVHPSVIVAGYNAALNDALIVMDEISVPIDANNDAELLNVINSCLSSKFSARWGPIVGQLALNAAKCVKETASNGKVVLDIKKYVKIEKLAGGEIEESRVLDGVMVNKDIVHPKMRRKIESPKILLLDCPLEYKKAESQTNVEITKEADWAALLDQEEEEVKTMCESIVASGCTVVVTEKGVSDLAQHFLVKANISVLRRVRKTDNNRIAKISGATIVNRTEEIQASDVGTQCKLFEINKIGDEYYSFFTMAEDPKACTLLLRGGSKDVLNEIERNLHDALNVCRNIMIDGKLLPGGGACDMEISARLLEKSNSIKGVSQWPYKAICSAFEVIPRTLAQNSGGDVVRIVTDLRARHSKPDGTTWGLDGLTGEVIKVETQQIWDALSVKKQIYKTAIEAACMILRIDDVLSGISKKGKEQAAGGAPEDPETFGDARDG